MIEKALMEFLGRKTTLEELGNEALLHSCPEFGKAVGEAIRDGRLIPFSVELSGRLNEMDPYKANLLSNFIGFACEKEGDTAAGKGLVRFFSVACTQVYEMFQSMKEDSGKNETGEKGKNYPLPPKLPELYLKNSDWAGFYCGFNILCVSVMAFLTRDAGLRGMLVEMELAEPIRCLTEEVPHSPYLKSISYVNSMLTTCSALKLLVLQPGRQQGFYATANDLNNCFHLLFLLEEQIMQTFGAKYGQKSFSADASLVKLAHGEYPQDAWGKSYTTCFMECNYSAADHVKFENEDGMKMIWGEMPPDCIPAIDGHAVIVLMESGVSRSFDAPFLFVPHNALNPYVRIGKELTKEEYTAWTKKITSLKDTE